MGKRLRLLVILLALLLTQTAGAGGDSIAWRQDTPAQGLLKTYITTANTLLSEQGEAEINSLFELYPQTAVLGITLRNNAEIPEDVEITVRMLYASLSSLQLRVSDVTRFPTIAGCLIRAMNPEKISWESATDTAKARADKAIRSPANSFEETVDELNGTVPRTYYAYYPNEYHDGVNWIQMTLIFPLEGYDVNGQLITADTATPVPDLYSDTDRSEDYDGYYYQDDYSHYDFFVTPTPEPDSAAAELETYR